MDWGALIGPILSIFGGNQQANQSRAAGAAATSGENQINQQLEDMLKALGGNASTAEAFFQNEANQGMDPGVMGAADTNFTNSFMRQLNTMVNQLGAGTPNPAGMARDLSFQGTEGLATLNSDLAGQQQQFKNQAMQDYFQTAMGLAGQTNQTLQPIGQRYADAAAAAAGAPNPYVAAGAALAGVPSSVWANLFGGRAPAAPLTTGNVGSVYGTYGQGALDPAYTSGAQGGSASTFTGTRNPYTPGFTVS